MGIQGLLPLLKDIQEKSHISKYRGLTVGIDVYCWLHKGGYGCAKDIVFKKPTKVYINYVMRRVDMLISYNITPILVFDGGHLPAKAATEADRRKRRKEHRERGMAAMKEGNMRDANEQFQRCFDITPEMAGEVIQECFKMNVQCIVAPYEADAQLAYLMIEGITQLTISEDSDLLLYGCDKVMYKMSVDGEGYVVDLANLSNVQTVKLSSFTVEKFRHMCMLSGCDYLASIKGMGLMKAFKALRRFSNVFQCIKSLRCDKAFTVPKDYDERFRKADLVFKYQLVFDIRSKQLVRLNKVDELDVFGDAEKDYAGRKIDDQMGLQIALGNIDPISGKILAHHVDFASGDISEKAAKSASWNSPPPPKNTNTAFAFHHSQQAPAASTPKNNQCSTPKNNQCEKKANQSCKVAEDATNEPAKLPTAQAEANKSLQKLKNEQVSVPTREDKIRILYQEEEKDDVITSYETEKATSPDAHKDENEKGEDEKDAADQDFLAGCPTVHPRHHSVFKKNQSVCKKKNRKNPFRQSNEQPSNKIVVSRFFGSKVSTDKENVNVLQVDTPSPEKGFAVTHNSPTKPQLEGSFLDYLDKTNVRTCQVNHQVLTLHSPKKTCKQKKIEVLCSPKKRKRMNLFSIKNELSPVKPEQSPVKCQVSNGADVDFNVAVELDEDSEYVLPTQVGSCKSEVSDNNSNCNKKVTNNTSRKVNLKLGLCKSNTKSTLANRTNMFSHFESKNKSNMHSDGLSKNEKVSGIFKSRNNVNAGSDEFCNQLNAEENALPSSVEKQREIESHCSPPNSEWVAGNDKKTKLTLGLCRNSTKRSSINNMFSNFERKVKGGIRLSKPSVNDKEVGIIKNKENDSGQSIVSNVIYLDEDSNEHSTTDDCVIETVKDCDEENEGCCGKERRNVNNVEEKDKGKVFCHSAAEEETTSDTAKMFDGKDLQSQLEGDEVEDGETDLLFNCVVGEREALVSVEDDNCDHSPPSPSESDEIHMNTVTQLGKKEGARGSGESDQLDEEPLPSHLKDEKQSVTGTTMHRKEEKNDQTIVYLDDEEPLPFHLDTNLDGMNYVHSSALLAKLGKRSKPIGLSKKRKLSERMKSDEKLKQMTFDRFGFKKKRIQRSDAVDIICLN